MSIFDKIRNTQSRASIFFIFMALLVDGMAAGIIAPVFPDLVRKFGTDSSFVAEYLGYSIALFALAQTLISPVLGMFSDRFGRRPILLIALFGASVDFIVMAFLPSMTWLLIARLVAGATAAGETVANAYLADISNDETLAKNLGMSSLALSAGYVVGPALGGLLAGYGVRAPFLFAGALSFLNLFMGFIVLPESLPKEKRRRFRLARVNPFSSMLGARKRQVVGLLLIMGFFDLATAGNGSVWALFTEQQLGWTAQEVGWSFTFLAISFGVMMTIGTHLVVPKFGEASTTKFAAMVLAVSCAAVGFTSKGWMLYGVTVFYAFGLVVFPVLEASIARQYPANKQGELSGMMNSMRTMMSIPGPIMFTYIFRKSTHFPGAPYVVAGGIVLFAFILLNLKSVTRGHLVDQPT